MRQLPALILLLTALIPWAHASSTPTAPVGPATCQAGPQPGPPLQAAPLPSSVTGRVSFYAALYGKTGPTRSLALGDMDAVYPLASTFKPLVVHGILRDVDAGKFKLNTPFTTTAANRSIEGYPAGTNTLQELAQRAIHLSDNTANDILQLAYGPARLAREVRATSPCTTVLHTTKAWWAAQAGLTPDVLGPDPLTRLRTLAQQSFEQRLLTARVLNTAAQAVAAPRLEAALDAYFHGQTYTPELEYYVQNTSTARAYTDLMAQTLSGADLKPGTRAVYRKILQSGCCRPKTPRLQATYWAAKAGSGWRLLTLTGYVETPGGVMAYTYLNDQSDVTDAEEMEKQIRPVVAWIEGNLLTLQGAR
ncbi:serine hydrolase [Deinococcus aluminii]|uniref:Beta-lactamase class A catalytic domain-containing protein n=1 Tax=Deinococcus aluminii TaxID=1656885 RepID=A0ABP9XEQ7_9DEIO